MTGKLRQAAILGGPIATFAFFAGAFGLYAATYSTHVKLDAPRPVLIGFGAVAIAFAAVGSLILLRRPDNIIGWLFWGMGLFVAFGTFAQEYAVFAVVGRSATLVFGGSAAWLQSWCFLTAVTTGLGLLLLLFPDGRLLGRRWRIVAWMLGVGFVCFVLGYALDPGPVRDAFASVDNPFGVQRAAGISKVLVPIGFFLSFLAIPAAAVSVWLRYRRASGIERQQVKWLASSAVVVVVFFMLDSFLEHSDVGEPIASTLMVLALIGIPVAAGTAILRHGLYEIDVVINRALVYVSLTALLACAYVGLVLVLQAVLRPLIHGSGLAVALSTLAIAALFRPARNRVQRLVDRRFYRHKYDAERTLQAFALHLRDEIELESLRSELTAVVAQTMQPAHVSLRLRDGG